MLLILLLVAFVALSSAQSTNNDVIYEDSTNTILENIHENPDQESEGPLSEEFLPRPYFDDENQDVGLWQTPPPPGGLHHHPPQQGDRWPRPLSTANQPSNLEGSGRKWI
ncbi:proline-rich protein 4-like [Pteronotus mesoamericanus]|uniref:proline-rich protein 4-like n=1 Tax=Pteronotus mesoamericanus TaxID=1884717 RepID=UPI0023EBB33E|nr:proline-rich protein 4-like [Pteronotus parnellii mesoamericanus]